MKLLDGKVAVITGAARGIGKAIALKFASEGADIAFTDLVIDENGLATQNEIEALGVKAKGYASNAANFEETHNVIAEIVKDFGRIDILVNNAGITKDGLMLRMTEAQWDAVIAVNLKSAFNFIHAMSRLPKTQQLVIELSRFKQLSNKEVAERLSLSEQTVKNQLSLGLKMLRSLLGNAPIIGLFFILNDLFRYVDK